MKLNELKQHVYDAWKELNTWKGGIVMQPENFKSEMKTFGDLRQKDTWRDGIQQQKDDLIIETVRCTAENVRK